MINKIILEDIQRIKRQVGKEDFKGKKVLVTGGAGFIGSWICDVLMSLAAEVTCLDNLSTGKMNYVEHLLDAPSFQFLNQDVCTFKSGERYDLIFHLASHASPEEYLRNPIETLRTNSLGSQNMVELARRLDATVLFASTSEIYGDAEVIPTPSLLTLIYALFLRNHAKVLARPSSKLIFGFHPKSFFAKLISGHLLRGSSSGKG